MTLINDHGGEFENHGFELFCNEHGYGVTFRPGKGPTRGNRRVPLSGTQFFELYLRARKANDNQLIFNLINYPYKKVYVFKRFLLKIRQNPV